MEVQTRSSSGNLYFKSVKEAYEAYHHDKTIWKISWDGHRFYTRTRTPHQVSKEFEEVCKKYGAVNTYNDRGKHEAEELRLCHLSEDYANCTNSTKIFWVNEPMEKVVEITVKSVMDDTELCLADAIIEVLTEEQFQEKYCI